MNAIKEKEKDVQRAILDYLELRGEFYYRNNTGAFVFPATDHSARRFIRASTKGAPDIVVVRDGKYIGVEVKGTDGRQSEDQMDFARRLIKAGGEYILAHSLDGFIQQFDALTKSPNQSR